MKRLKEELIREQEEHKTELAARKNKIAELKEDHKIEIAKAQEIIANIRSGSQDNKGAFTKEIEIAE